MLNVIDQYKGQIVTLTEGEEDAVTMLGINKRKGKLEQIRFDIDNLNQGIDFRQERIKDLLELYKAIEIEIESLYQNNNG